MAMPKVLDWLDELVAKVATNTANIAKNASDIAENKKLFDTHVADDERTGQQKIEIILIELFILRDISFQ